MQIVKFTVSVDFFMSDEWMQMYELVQPVLESMTTWIHDSSGITAIVSNPAEIDDSLSVLHIPFTREDLTAGYERWITTAPKAFDYDYVIQLGTIESWRIVAIPAESVGYQNRRYLSGLYFVEKA